MKRKTITIHKEKCNGCGICAFTCHKEAIETVDGKTELLNDHYCDGFGDCFPSRPTGTITLEGQKADAYDEEAVKNRLRKIDIEEPDEGPESQLKQWPVQIKLFPVMAPHYKDCNLLITADYTAFTYGNFHSHFMKSRVTVIGCPKLGNKDYSGKPTEIIEKSEIKTVIILHMEVPCCRGMEMVARKTMEMSSKDLPWRVMVVSTERKLLPDSH